MLRREAGQSGGKKAKRTTTEVGQTVPTSPAAETRKATKLRRATPSPTYEPSATTTTASVSSGGNRARSAPSKAASRQRAKQQRARRLQRAIKQIQEPTRAPPRVERRVKAELQERATGRQAERIKKLKVRVVPKLGVPVRVSKRQIKVSPRAAKTVLPRAPQKPQGTAQKPGQQVKKVAKKKVAVEVPEVVPPKLRKVVAKQGQRLNDALKQAGSNLSGPEYLAKLIQFESGWSPTAENPSSAYGLGQFIDSTAQDFRERLGVETQDPKRPAQMVKGAAMHASGKHGYGALYAGYNPGYGSDPIPSTESGANVKVKVSKKAAKRVAGGDIATKGSAAEQKPGAWQGAKKAVLEVVPKAARAEGLGDKRTPEENSAVGGSETSDHLTTNTGAYAADLPANDALAQKIAKRLGMASHTGTNEVTKDGYRYQLIWQDEGHYDHIHLGASWVGAGAPESAPVSVGGVTTGGTTTAVSGAAPSAQSVSGASATPAKAVARKRRKKRERDEKLKRALALIRQGLPAELGAYEVPTTRESFAEQVRSAPVEVGL